MQFRYPLLHQPVLPRFESAPAPMQKMETQYPAASADQQRSFATPASLKFLQAPSHSFFTGDDCPAPSIDPMIETSSFSSLPITTNRHRPACATPFVAELRCTSAIPREQDSLHSKSTNIPCIASFKAVSHDDGSVASRLLSSVTKSIPITSLQQLADCKEVARETPFQKSLKLKHMKLQHCAEGLGMESSNSASSSLVCNDISNKSTEQEDGNIFKLLSGYPATVVPNVVSHQGQSLPPMISSAIHNDSLSKMGSPYSKHTRCSSFPPPLSHTLPVSYSCESMSLSLHPLRKDGRLILKEVMAPSKHYFNARRRDGRLTLHLLVRDIEDEEEEAVFGSQNQKRDICRDTHELEDIDESGGITPVQGSSMISTDGEEVEAGHKAVPMLATNKILSLDEDAGMIKASKHSARILKADHFTELPNIFEKAVVGQRLSTAPPCDLKSLIDRSLNVAEATDLRYCILQSRSHYWRDPTNFNANIVSNALALSGQAISRDRQFTLQKAERNLCLFSPSNGIMEACGLNPSGHVFLTRYHDMAKVHSTENFI